jgi:DNA polymerase III subunit delta
MQVRTDALPAWLKTHASALPMSAWVHGDEPLLQIEATDAIRAALRDTGYAERQVFHVDRAFRIEQFAGEADSMSLFSPKRVLELRLSAKPGKELGEGIAAVVSRLAEGVRVLIASPRLDRAATETAWFREIDRHSLVVPVFPIEPAQLPQWIGQRLERQGQRADRETLELMAVRVEGNLLAAHQEIQKLGLLFGPGLLPAAELQAAVLNVSRYDAFDAAQAMLSGDVAKTLRTVEGLRAEGQAEPLVLWALADALRTVLRASQAVARGRPAAQALRELRVFPPRDRVYERAIARLRIGQIRAALQVAARTDRMIKGVAPGNAWRSIETLALSVAGAALPTVTDSSEF